MKINYFPLEKNNKNLLYFYTPYLLLLCWILFSFISIFFIEFKYILNGFILFSLIIRLIIIGAGLYFFYNIFIKLRNDKKFFNFFKAYVGYGIIFTYVFYSLPRMVGEFEGTISKSSAVFNYLFVLFISVFPVFLYLFLRSDETRLILKIYNDKEIEFEKKVKKDKSLKKKEHERLKKERTFIENLWYEWVDVIIQAIIIALIIQQFLFQMYQIPSESMVPTFIKRDRVVVNKAIYGPHIPLTDWKLYSPIKPKIGDIVVFINPEVDNPSSDMRYKNVFTRIFHPFIFMLTLSTVDIDKKDDGSPKERFIVKRCIAVEDEKICLVNDKVYKKKKDSEWKSMGEIANQKEYGRPDLYYYDNPNMDNQNMTPYIRSLLNEVQTLVEADSIDSLEKSLINAKNNFISSISRHNKNSLSANIESILKKNEETRNKNYQELINIAGLNLNFNNTKFLINSVGKDRLTQAEIKKYENELFLVFENYIFNVYLDNISLLKEELSLNKNYTSEIKTKINISDEDNPYIKYMKRLNAFYKISLMNFYTELLNNNIDISFNNPALKNKKGNFYKMFLLSIYLDGFDAINYYEGYNAFAKENINLFSLRNFYEFPSDKNTYLKKGEYFMMGDNRYNSLDSRLGYVSNEIYIDESDKGVFSKKVTVSWVPHTIKDKHVLGKAEFIYWPMDRITILK